jgi:hypothetical protein
LGLDRIGAHAEDGDAKLVEFFLCVTKLGRFDRSTGRVCLGKEKEQNTLPPKIGEGKFGAVIGLQAEKGSLGTWFEHESDLQRF